MNRSLATRLRVGLALLFVLLVGVTAAGVGRLFDLRTNYEDANTYTYQLELAAEQARAAFIVQQAAIRGSGTSRRPNAGAFRDGAATADRVTAHAQELAGGDGDTQATLERRASAAQRWRNEIAEPALAGRTTDPKLAAQLAGAVLEADQTLVARQREVREALRKEVAGDSRATLIWILVGLGCALAVGLFVFAVIANAMAKPVTQLVRAARRLAGGDLSARVQVEGPAETAQLGRAFNEMAGELQTAERLKDEFLATVSHELRSPLTSMQGFAELLLVERDELSEEQIHHIEVILSANHQLTGIVNDLLDLARSDAGRLRIEPRPSEVEPIVGDVTRLLERRIAAKGQRLEVDLEAALPWIEVDPGRIIQVLGNLLTNAHLYTPEGGTIRIAGRRTDGSGVELQVSDTGPGMSREQLDHAFDRFWRADATDSRAVGGTGLGLAIARSLVELHGGEIEASSPPGGGARFRVLLPTAQTRATG